MKTLLAALLLSTPAVTFAAESFVIQDFAQFGIAAQVRKLQDPRFNNLSYAEDKYYLEVSLGRLTQSQYTALRAMYGNLTQVPYEAAKSYDLIDFLHPAIQATANQVLEPIHYDLEKLYELDIETLSEEGQMTLWGFRKNGFSYYSNCWNTTTQILNLMNPENQKGKMNYSVYWPGRWDMTDELKDDKASSLITAKDLKYGDALLVFDKADSENDMGMIQHTAMVLSPSLVFEKTDSSENDPYRISLRADVLKKYKKVFEGQAKIEYRRYNQKGKTLFNTTGPTTTLRQDITAEDAKQVEKLIPDLMDTPMTVGCETGMGGGCDVTSSEKITFEVVKNPKTGRGIFKGPKKYLDRYKALKGT